jgi:hypothetical protein
METIVIRLWVPGPAEASGPLVGVLEHPASGSQRAFADEAELVRLLRERRSAATGPGVSGRGRAGERR